MLIDKALEQIGFDKGTSFALYLIQYANPKTKIFDRTYKQIQEDLNISQVTIARYFRVLEEDGFIERRGIGAWYIPAVISRTDTCDGTEWYVESKYEKKSGRP